MKKNIYKTGKYIPVNPSKYIGSINDLIYKSKLELLYFRFFDKNKNILEWGYEVVKIPYISKIDGRRHTYIIDIFCKVKTKRNTIEKKLIEIKPLEKTKMPLKGKNESEKSFVYRLKEYAINDSKWRYAKEYAKKYNYDFIKMTEKDIF